MGLGCLAAAQGYTRCNIPSGAGHLPVQCPHEPTVLDDRGKACSRQCVARISRLLAVTVGIGVAFAPLSTIASPPDGRFMSRCSRPGETPDITSRRAALLLHVASPTCKSQPQSTAPSATRSRASYCRQPPSSIQRCLTSYLGRSGQPLFPKSHA